jgi:hypothetical protein
MYEYAHTPSAKPAAQEHEYAPSVTYECDDDSMHVAPFAHGELLHSLMSLLQLVPE